MDYTKFLGKKDELVLPYLGGPHVHAKDRRLRVEDPRPAIGWHRFEVRGRTARAIDAVEADEVVVGALGRARGHLVHGFLFGKETVRVALLPAEEPAPFSVVRARRWYSGEHLFEGLDFDGDAEEAARLRLERREALPASEKGVPASLRVAYGVALARDVARRRGVELAVREVLAHGPRIAEEGEAAAHAFVTAVEDRRRGALEAARIRAIVHGQRPPAPVVARQLPLRDRPTLDNAPLRAEVALDGARARMLSSRSLGNGNLEVVWAFMDERFVSVVDAITLQVYDSGVCLAGADELVTLDSLPGVIREAIETDALVITRH